VTEKSVYVLRWTTTTVRIVPLIIVGCVSKLTDDVYFLSNNFVYILNYIEIQQTQNGLQSLFSG
jgi:hypothetical protein